MSTLSEADRQLERDAADAAFAFQADCSDTTASVPPVQLQTWRSRRSRRSREPTHEEIDAMLLMDAKAAESAFHNANSCALTHCPPSQPRLVRQRRQQGSGSAAQQQQQQQLTAPQRSLRLDKQCESENLAATAKALSASRQHQQRSTKGNLRRSGPLKLGLPSSAPPRAKSSSDDEQQLLRQCQAYYSTLPERSSYAKHRLKLLAKAIELLKRSRASRTQEEAEELQSLLSSLNIGSTAGSNTIAASHGNSAGAGMECDMQQAEA